MKSLNDLPKLKPGDQVAVVSPAGDAAGRFPWVLNVGLERLSKNFGLRPKEYPTTRQINASKEEKARDLMAAFSDSENKAVLSTIGGYDQVRLIKYLDPKVFLENPKPFFGYSDNTHFINFLWNLGIPAYYGGGVMTQFGYPVAMQELSTEYLKHALFGVGEFEVKQAKEFGDETYDWGDQDSWNKPTKKEPNEGWLWDGNQDAQGILWGGCLEAFAATFASGHNIPKDNELDGGVLFLETSEEMPVAWMVAHLLNGLGERGWFDKFRAVLFGRPKAWHFDKMLEGEEKVKFKKDQKEAVLASIRFYNSDIPIIQNMDFGHTDPQIVVPSGQKVRILSSSKQIFFTY